MIGKTISHYKILEKLGEGGMGEDKVELEIIHNVKVDLEKIASAVDDASS